MVKLKAPFPYFGGKSKVSGIVWNRLGEVDNYIEPFFGSGAMLLGRPDFDSENPQLEAVNDLDAYIANFWRAMANSPEKLAEIVDNPVNEVDLEAWHKWLVTASRKAELAEKCKNDPEYYDIMIAGRWCWGLCQWIGVGWCSGEWYGNGSRENKGRGINIKDPEHGGKLPHLGDAGRGVHKQRPHLGNAGMGVHKQRPHLGNAGMGVHKKRPHLGNNGNGVHPCSEWFFALQQRLRKVRVCCGDWSRIVTPCCTCRHGVTGVFLDPPYADTANRTKDLYSNDSLQVAHDIREWAIKEGENPLMRIVLAGYDGEHDMPANWNSVNWKANGGYANQTKRGSQGKANATKEMLWFSPHCKRPERTLFDEES